LEGVSPPLYQESAILQSFGTGTEGWLHINPLFSKNQNNSSTAVIGVLGFVDWGWALAARQVGVATVACWPQEERVADLLSQIRQHVTGLTVAPTGFKSLGDLGLVVGHGTTPGHLSVLLAAAEHTQTERAVFTCPSTIRRMVLRLLQGSAAYCHLCWEWQDISHRSLNGLSGIVVSAFVIFRGPPQSRLLTEDLSSVESSRDVSGFIEPSARLTDWRPVDSMTLATTAKRAHNELIQVPCGRRDRTGRILAWDPSMGPVPPPLSRWNWVVTHTVYLGGKRIARPLSDKEKCQLLDIREDWAPAAARIWAFDCPELVDQSNLLPCRIPGFLLRLLHPWWLRVTANTVDSIGERNWDVVRAWPSREDGALVQGRYRAFLFEPGDAAAVTIAAKADDAEADFSLWDVGGTTEAAALARQRLRKFFHRMWYTTLEAEAWNWLDGRCRAGDTDITESRDAILDCLRRARNSTWFEWGDGSRLFFWRWPTDFWREARDGHPIRHYSLPRPRHYTRTVQVEDWMQDKMNTKLRKFFRRRYLVPMPKHLIRVFIVYFPVKKGEDDIRVVWSETENGVNETVFAPRFFLPSVGTLVRRTPPGAFIGDFDIGEMFHNFVLHERDRPYHGVHVPQDLWDEFRCRTCVWSRLPMGFTPSPYIAGRNMMRALEYAKGDPSDQGNPFAFSAVELNLPMAPDYDPTLPRVNKRTHDGLAAGDALPYVDDGRDMGRDEAHTMACERYLVSRLEHLGIQDAKRKRRPVSQRPGAWNGGVIYTDRGITRRFLDQSRWDKAKGWITWFRQHLTDPDGYERKDFLKGRGFLVYASMTYEFMTPFLKGLHLSVEIWRGGRDYEGWRLDKQSQSNVGNVAGDDPDIYSDPEPEWLEEDTHLILKHHGELDTGDEELVSLGLPARPPPRIAAVPRLGDDLSALEMFFQPKSPIMVPETMSEVFHVFYGFGDASGEGYGSAVLPKESPRARLRKGFWCQWVSERASNFREFKNLLETVKDMKSCLMLEAAEIWLFTDNQVSERVYYKGNSHNRELFDLMLELRMLMLEAGAQLHIVHVAGTRMIREGTDGLSRGELHLGGFLDGSLQVVPLHLDPIQRQPKVLSWIESWTSVGEPKTRLARPVDWPHRAHQPDHTWIWSLAPAAALYALEELSIARLKRMEKVIGIVLCPRLMCPEWFRRFSRTVDVYFSVPAGVADFWPGECHEPLLIGFVLPLLRINPWAWRDVTFMVGLGRTLSSVHKTDPDAGRYLLQQFWTARSRAAVMPEGVVRGLLSRKSHHAFLSLSRPGR